MTLVLPDVNILVSALRRDADRHHVSLAWLDDAVNGPDELALVPATVVGTVRVATNPRIFDPPADRAVALRFVAALRGAPRSVTLPATDGVWARLDQLVADDRQARGNLVPDAWLAALAIEHDARLVSFDRGMARWPGLSLLDPSDHARDA